MHSNYTSRICYCKESDDDLNEDYDEDYAYEDYSLEDAEDSKLLNLELKMKLPSLLALFQVCDCKHRSFWINN